MINDETDRSGMIDYAWSHAIISDQLYNNIRKECSFGDENQTTNCAKHIKGFLQAYSDIDIYSIYTPVCLSATLSSSPKRSSNKLAVAPRLFTRHVRQRKFRSFCLSYTYNIYTYRFLVVKCNVGNFCRRCGMDLE